MYLGNKKNHLLSEHFRYSLLLLIIFVFQPAVVLAALNVRAVEQSSLSDSQLPASLQKRPYEAYGPVRNNEGLWEISDKLHDNFVNSPEDVSIPQIAVALFETNPQAFRNHNMNGLLGGVILIIPDQERVLKMSQADAFTLFLQHWETWKTTYANVDEAKEFSVRDDSIESIEQPETTALTVLSDQKNNFHSKSLNSLEARSLESKVEPKINESPMPKKVLSEELKASSQINIKHPDKILQAVQHEQQEVATSFSAHIPQISFNFFSGDKFQGVSEASYSILGFFKQFSYDKSSIVSLIYSPVSIFLFAGGLFLYLFWLSRSKESDLLEIKPSEFIIDTIDNDIMDNRYLKTQKLTAFELTALPHDIEPACNEKQVDPSDPPTDNPVDIYQNLTFEDEPAERENKNILEAIFENNINSDVTGLIEEDEEYIEDTDSSEVHLLDSVDEIRFVNEKTSDSKVNAFLKITESEKVTDELLTNDYEQINKNEEIDVFIQEFEEIMSNLTEHTPEVDDSSNDFDNLLQFKLSIHFIKALSNMMQASYLKRFSTTVIEFLEDVLDGNVRMTTDTNHRLNIVVNFYEHYLHSLKENFKLEV